jgi:hypothetical protein
MVILTVPDCLFLFSLNPNAAVGQGQQINMLTAATPTFSAFKVGKKEEVSERKVRVWQILWRGAQ